MTVAIACFPLRHTGLPGNYFPDLGYHLVRIEAIKESILAGHFPIRIGSMILNGWGYGSSLFYPDYFLYIAGILRVCGVSIEWSYKIMIIFATVLIAVSTYFSFLYITKNKYGSAIATSLLMLSQYYLADIYNRAGISEYIAFIFIPILLAGLYDLLSGEGKQIKLIGFGLFGLICSHSITFAMGVVLVIICVLFSITKLWNNKALFRNLIIIGITTILASAFVYIPLLEQLFSGDFRFHHPWANIEDMTEPISSWFLLKGYYSTIAYIGIGIPIFAGIAIRICKKKWDNKWIDRVLCSGIVLILITCKYFPWKLVGNTIFNFIQFPYRLYSFAFPLLALGIGMLFSELLENQNRKYYKFGAYLFVCFLSLFFGLKQARFTDYAEETMEMSDDFFANEENTFYIGAEEWLPSGLKGKHLIGKERNVRDFNGNAFSFIEGYNEITFDVGSSNSSFDVPLVYYKGYSANLRTSEGKSIKLPVITDGNSGKTIVENNTGMNGTIQVYYIGTVLQKISLWISGLTILGYIVVILSKGRGRKYGIERKYHGY